MSEHIKSVKDVAAYLRENEDRQRSGGKSEIADKLGGFAAALECAAEHIIKLEGLTKALPPELGNIHDLPQDLLDELSVAKTDEIEDQIVTVINAYGGEASLDQLLVGLFRKFEVVQKRKFLMNKLYRMSTIWSVEGRKGIYTTTEPKQTDPEVERLLGATEDQYTPDIDDEVPF